MLLPAVYLASKSPRRKHLLEACHIDFELVDAEIDESNYPDDLPMTSIAEYLACAKAARALDIIDQGIVIAADSLVLCNGNILGKPVDRNDAIRMLSMLSGRRHEVITGVCVQDQKKRIAFSDISYVTFSHLTEDEIIYYIDHFNPYDKAGAYAIQEWLGHRNIQHTTRYTELTAHRFRDFWQQED